MLPITFEVEALRGIPGDLDGTGAVMTPPKRAKVLQYLLDTLGRINDDYLKDNPKAPRLYDTQVRYQAEPDSESWRDIGSILKANVGDCEDLASYRAAELRKAGIRARTVVRWQEGNGATVYHILVERDSIDSDLPPGLPNPRFLRESGDKWLEDPSAVLGM